MGRATGSGSENENLPAFVVLVTGQVLGAGNSAWGSGFLPTVHQGIEFRSEGDPVLFLSNPKGVSAADRRRTVDAVKHLNGLRLADVGDPEIATRIAQYEMAYRMQASVPELMDINERAEGGSRALRDGSRGRRVLRTIACWRGGWWSAGCASCSFSTKGWDHHGSVFNRLPGKANRWTSR